MGAGLPYKLWTADAVEWTKCSAIIAIVVAAVTEWSGEKAGGEVAVHDVDLVQIGGKRKRDAGSY